MEGGGGYMLQRTCCDTVPVFVSAGDFFVCVCVCICTSSVHCSQEPMRTWANSGMHSLSLSLSLWAAHHQHHLFITLFLLLTRLHLQTGMQSKLESGPDSWYPAVFTESRLIEEIDTHCMDLCFSFNFLPFFLLLLCIHPLTLPQYVFHITQGMQACCYYVIYIYFISSLNSKDIKCNAVLLPRGL